MGRSSAIITTTKTMEILYGIDNGWHCQGESQRERVLRGSVLDNIGYRFVSYVFVCALVFVLCISAEYIDV